MRSAEVSSSFGIQGRKDARTLGRVLSLGDAPESLEARERASRTDSRSCPVQHRVGRDGRGGRGGGVGCASSGAAVMVAAMVVSSGARRRSALARSLQELGCWWPKRRPCLPPRRLGTANPARWLYRIDVSTTPAAVLFPARVSVSCMRRSSFFLGVRPVVPSQKRLIAEQVSREAHGTTDRRAARPAVPGFATKPVDAHHVAHLL